MILLGGCLFVSALIGDIRRGNTICDFQRDKLPEKPRWACFFYSSAGLIAIIGVLLAGREYRNYCLIGLVAGLTVVYALLVTCACESVEKERPGHEAPEK